MVVLGLWLGIVGYAITYAGVVKLGGGTCSLGQAFRGQCSPSSRTSSATGSSSGTTTLGRQQALAAQQASSVPSTPIASGSSTMLTA
ncbi:MAG TPA: hypothetical protein VEQ15_00255 [Myxococcales bacterium]|nr:hypothetical protein [Myxococcales bacterium]